MEATAGKCFSASFELENKKCLTAEKIRILAVIITSSIARTTLPFQSVDLTIKEENSEKINAEPSSNI